MKKSLCHRLTGHPGWLTFGFGFLFFAFIMACAPYASDDLEFASLPYSRFGEYLKYALEYGNGRLLGNLTSILLSKFRLLCILVKALVMALTVVLIPRVLGLEDPGSYLVSFLLIGITDAAVFGEAFVWTSGFSNYIPPIFCALLILAVIKDYPRLVNPAAKALSFLLVAVLGIAAQLFIEHSAGVNVLLALSAAVFAWKRSRKSLPLACTWVITAAAGLLLMLLIPKLFYIVDNHTDSYRSAHLGSIAAMVISCAKNVIQLSNHYFGSCSLPLCFGSLATVWLGRSRRSVRSNRILSVLALVCTGYTLLSLTLGLEIYLGKAAVVQHAISSVCVFLNLITWAVAAWNLESALRQKLYLCLGFAVVSLVPLLVVTPIPNRVIFQSYVFVIMGAMLCLRELEQQLPQSFRKVFPKAAAVCALLLVLLLGSVFTSVAFMAQIRDRHIRSQIHSGATEIQVFSLPYRYTTWDHLWSLRYLYPAQQEVQFSTMDFDNWMNDIYK